MGDTSLFSTSFLPMLPALCVLGVFTLVALFLIARVDGIDWLKLYSGRIFFLLGLLGAVFLLGAIALFQGQEWASDGVLLALGAFIGAGAATLSQGMSHTPDPTPKEPARMPSQLGSSMARFVSQAAATLDHDIHFIAHRRNPVQDIQNITEAALKEGWNLSSIELGNQAYEGIILVFTRVARPEGRKLRFHVDGHTVDVPLV